MKIKRIFVISAIFLLLTSPTFAMGAGVQAGFTPCIQKDVSGDSKQFYSNYSGNVIGSIRLFRIPAQFGFGIELSQDHSTLDVGINGMFDYLYAEKTIINNWGLYAGIGINGAVLFNSHKDTIFTAGGRFLIGYNWIFRDNYMELFTQFALNPTAEFKNQHYSSFKINFPLEVGFRVHY